MRCRLLARPYCACSCRTSGHPLLVLVVNQLSGSDVNLQCACIVTMYGAVRVDVRARLCQTVYDALTRLVKATEPLVQPTQRQTSNWLCAVRVDVGSPRIHLHVQRTVTGRPRCAAVCGRMGHEPYIPRPATSYVISPPHSRHVAANSTNTEINCCTGWPQPSPTVDCISSSSPSTSVLLACRPTPRPRIQHPCPACQLSVDDATACSTLSDVAVTVSEGVMLSMLGREYIAVRRIVHRRLLRVAPRQAERLP